MAQMSQNQVRSVPYSSVLFCTVLSCSVLCLFCSALFHSILFCSVPRFTVLQSLNIPLLLQINFLISIFYILFSSFCFHNFNLFFIIIYSLFSLLFCSLHFSFLPIRFLFFKHLFRISFFHFISFLF